MSFLTKLRIFWHAGRGILGVLLFLIFAQLAAIYLPFFDSAEDTFGLLVLQLTLLGVGVALVFTWLKIRRGIMAAESGERLEAVVLKVRASSDGEIDPTYYVMTWKDAHGFTCRSLPDTKEAFDGMQPGDRIIVYKNNDHDSWWERDIFGHQQDRLR